MSRARHSSGEYVFFFFFSFHFFFKFSIPGLRLLPYFSLDGNASSNLKPFGFNLCLWSHVQILIFFGFLAGFATCLQKCKKHWENQEKYIALEQNASTGAVAICKSLTFKESPWMDAVLFRNRIAFLGKCSSTVSLFRHIWKRVPHFLTMAEHFFEKNVALLCTTILH